jgi:hypothetical protein
MKALTQTFWISALACSFAAACATTTDVEGEDFDDPDAKVDGPSQPSGMYTLVNPNSFDEGTPRIAFLDLRSDGTYYEKEFGPADNGDGNFQEGELEIFGDYKFTKDSHGNRYIRFDGGFTGDSFRWRFRTAANSTATLSFLYTDGDVGFKMHREVRPTATFVEGVKAGFSTAPRTTIADPTPTHWTGELPEALSGRVIDLRVTDGDEMDTIKASSFKVDGTKVYVLEWGKQAEHVEIFAQDSQLLAKTKSVAPLVWADLHP